MGDAYKTVSEAQAAALTEGLKTLDPTEGFTIRTCVCGRQDLHDSPELSSIMEACQRCEVTIIAPGGTA